MKHMTKKAVCLILSLLMVLSLSTTAFAIEAGDDTVTEKFPEEFVAPEYIYTEADLMRIQANETANPMATTAGTYVASFSTLTNDQMETVIGALGTAENILRTTYNGTQVFAFTSGGDTIYIPMTQLFRQTSGTCRLSEFNSTLTSRANADNTSPVYGYAYSSYQYSWNGNTIFRFSIAKISAQAYYHSNSDLYFKVRVEESIGIDVYETFIFGTSYTGSTQITPTVTLKITNTGGSSNSLFMGGYELEGFGRNTSTKTMGDLISIGYKATQIYGTISGSLTVSTLLSLFNDAVDLEKSLTLTGRNYFAEPMCLSNPAEGIYAYTCVTESPFAIEKADDYMILKIGLRGAPTSSTTYKVTTSFQNAG